MNNPKVNNTQKRVPKTDIKFNISLNEEQKEAKKLILENHVCLIKGSAGSGKTLLACNIALDGYFKKQIDKIIITRPMVSKTDMGFLPGDIKEKLDPWLQPIYSNLYQLYNRDKIDKMVEEGDIEISPIQFLRGRTFLNACLVEGEFILTENNGYMKVEDIFYDACNGIFYNVMSYNFENDIFEYKLLDAISPSYIDNYIEIEMENGDITKVSENHEFYTKRGLVKAKDLTNDDEILSY